MEPGVFGPTVKFNLGHPLKTAGGLSWACKKFISIETHQLISFRPVGPPPRLALETQGCSTASRKFDLNGSLSALMSF